MPSSLDIEQTRHGHRHTHSYTHAHSRTHARTRSVKWLTQVRVADEESYSTWQRGVAYKSFSANVKSWEGVDPAKANVRTP